MSWINIYWVIHYFVEGVKMAISIWHSEPNYRGGKNDLWKIAASFYFCTDISRYISQICWLQQSLLHYVPINGDLIEIPKSLGLNGEMIFYPWKLRLQKKSLLTTRI